jgi:hypothetical protein
MDGDFLEQVVYTFKILTFIHLYTLKLLYLFVRLLTLK